MSAFCCIGIDLSGPANIKDTALTLAFGDEERLTVTAVMEHCSDMEIYNLIGELVSEKPLIAIDAPLSYNQGGGFRPGEKALTTYLREKQLFRPGIMAPTMTKMVYLTLRGISLAHMLKENFDTVQIFENHPGSTLLLNGFDAHLVKQFKKEAGPRTAIIEGLSSRGMAFPNTEVGFSDHQLASCAACFCAWLFARGAAKWVHPAEHPFHPFPIVC